MSYDCPICGEYCLMYQAYTGDQEALEWVHDLVEENKDDYREGENHQ